jgi:hypothetical protein
LALLSDGAVMSWGWNEFGQLGDGTSSGPERCNNMACSRTPVTVSGLSGVTAVSAGNDHSLALLSGGTVMSWGLNQYGQLGNGSTNGSSAPVSVTGLVGVTAISAGGEHSLALLSNGTVMEWGGVEGPDTCFNGASCSTTPEAVSGLKGVTAISAGGEHNLALLSNGTVTAWGLNRFGQLGNGTTVSSEVPTKVSGLSNVTAISGASEESYALLSNGTVMDWGSNAGGDLGTGSSGPEICFANGDNGPCATTPVAVSGLTGVTAIAGREALLANGTVMDWGFNRFGELGDATVTGSDVPVKVSGLTQETAIGSRYAIGPPPTVTTVLKLKPSSGPVGGGTSVTITGAYLTGATAVKFGSTNASSFTVNSATSITAVSPAEAAGGVDVTVTTPEGTSKLSSADRFKFTPTITNVSPNHGPAAGGTSVTLTGTGFALGTTATIVKIGLKRATSVNCTSTTMCTAVTEAHEAGTVDVHVTVNKAASPTKRPADEFTYS